MAAGRLSERLAGEADESDTGWTKISRDPRKRVSAHVRFTEEALEPVAEGDSSPVANTYFAAARIGRSADAGES